MVDTVPPIVTIAGGPTGLTNDYVADDQRDGTDVPGGRDGDVDASPPMTMTTLVQTGGTWNVTPTTARRRRACRGRFGHRRCGQPRRRNALAHDRYDRPDDVDHGRRRNAGPMMRHRPISGPHRCRSRHDGDGDRCRTNVDRDSCSVGGTWTVTAESFSPTAPTTLSRRSPIVAGNGGKATQVLTVDTSWHPPRTPLLGLRSGRPEASLRHTCPVESPNAVALAWPSKGRRRQRA